MGTAPNRQLVLGWSGELYSDETIEVAFQIVLTEGTDTLEVRYLAVPPPGWDLTIGVEDPTGTIGTQHSLVSEAVVPEMALRFSP